MSEEEAQHYAAQLRADFERETARVLRGESPGVILMTFGEAGKTLLSGDPAQLILALETAKLKLLQFTLQQQAAQAASAEDSSVLFSMPSRGTA